MNIRYGDYEEKLRPQIEEMILALYEEDPVGMAMDLRKIRATLDHCGAHPEKIRLVTIWHEDELAGYSLVIFFWSNEFGGDILCLDELYIKKAYRRLGIASRFMQDLPQLFPGGAAISLEVTPTNEIAKTFYKHLGFENKENVTMMRMVNQYSELN